MGFSPRSTQAQVSLKHQLGLQPKKPVSAAPQVKPAFLRVAERQLLGLAPRPVLNAHFLLQPALQQHTYRSSLPPRRVLVPLPGMPPMPSLPGNLITCQDL